MSSKDPEDGYNEKIEELQKAAEDFLLNHNDGGIFLVGAQQCLERNNSNVLFDFLQDSQHRQLIDFVGWDLVKMVFRFLPEENDPENDCQNILLFICTTCSAREICFSLGEVLSCHLTWQKIIFLLHLLQLTCKRLEGKVAKIFSTILLSLTRFLRNREKKYDHLSEIVETILEFLRPYIANIHNCGSQSTYKDAKELGTELESFLIHLLEFPIAELDIPVTCGDGTETKNEQDSGKLCKFGDFSKTIVEFLALIEQDNFKKLVEHGVQQSKMKKEMKEDLKEEYCLNLSHVGLGCLFYLVHVKHIRIDCVPVVLTGYYILKTNIPYINVMLCNNQFQVVLKGLQLFLAILNLIEQDSLDHGLSEELKALTDTLPKLMTHSEHSDIRRQAVQALREILQRFQRRAKYKHLRLLNQNCQHSGMAEFLILLLKEEIAKCLQDEVEDEWFTGRNLASFLREIFCVPPKVYQSEYGIVEERNRILAALNLFRYLLIRDRKNKTLIQTLMSELETSFFKPLTDASFLSKVKLKELIKTKNDEISGKVPVSHGNEEIFSVATPNGCKLERGSLQEQLEVLQSAVLTVDMIESVLVRITELSEEHKPKT